MADEHRRLRLEVRGALLPVDRGHGPADQPADAWSRRRATWPACGAARTRTRGVHKAPANEVVLGANGLGFQVTQAEQGGLNKVGINCIRAFPGRGIRVWGARTLSSDPEWRYINVRRLFNYVSESIMEGTQWACSSPTTSGCGSSCGSRRRTSSRARGATARCSAPRPTQAFYVKCDAETNPPEVIEAGQVICEIGIAPVKPAEFVDLPPEPVHRRRRRRRQLSHVEQLSERNDRHAGQ